MRLIYKSNFKLNLNNTNYCISVTNTLAGSTTWIKNTNTRAPSYPGLLQLENAWFDCPLWHKYRQIDTIFDKHGSASHDKHAYNHVLKFFLQQSTLSLPVQRQCTWIIASLRIRVLNRVVRQNRMHQYPSLASLSVMPVVRNRLVGVY